MRYILNPIISPRPLERCRCRLRQCGLKTVTIAPLATIHVIEAIRELHSDGTLEAVLGWIAKIAWLDPKSMRSRSRKEFRAEGMQEVDIWRYRNFFLEGEREQKQGIRNGDTEEI